MSKSSQGNSQTQIDEVKKKKQDDERKSRELTEKSIFSRGLLELILREKLNDDDEASSSASSTSFLPHLFLILFLTFFKTVTPLQS